MVLICLFLCRSVSLHFPHPVFPLLPASLSLNLASPHLLLLYLSSSFSLPRPLPASQSCPASPLLLLLLLLLSGLYFSAPDVPPVANIVFLPPPLDMAKEAICALLAILGHFFEAFSPLDLFFALSPFRPVPRPFPDSVHLGFHRLVSPRSRTSPRLRLLVPALSSPRRSFQPSPAPVRPCQLRAVRTRPLSTHAGF